MDGKNKILEEDIRKIVTFVESVKYGSVNIIIQDGKIIQIEKNEKIRLK